jgi:hypothetical protein
MSDTAEAMSDLTTAQPEQITPLSWELHTTDRDEAERVFGL